MRRLVQEYGRFLVLLALFTIGVLIHQASLPVLEGSDETLHLNYVNLLKNENRLPDRTIYTTNSTWQESGQPPLYYWVTAQFLCVINLPPLADDLLIRLGPAHNQWFTPPDRWNYRDNFNLYYHGVNERAFGFPDVVRNNRVARLSSLAFGMVAVIGAYGAAREVFRRDGWALVATAIFAFTPQMVTMSASVTNDVGSTAFATLTIWQTLRLLRLGASPLRLIMVGILLALAGLSKVSALLIAPGVGLAILLDWRRRKLPFRQLVINSLLIGVVVILILGPWIAYGIASFGDPFGFKTHRPPNSAPEPTPSLAQLLSALPEVYLSYWGKFGTSAIWLSPLVYTLLSVLPILSLAGYLVYWVRCRRAICWHSLPIQQAVVLSIIFLCVFAGLIQWLRELFSIAYVITGRLIYGAHIAVAIGVTGGLYLLSLEFHRAGQAGQVLDLPLQENRRFVGAGLRPTRYPDHFARLIKTYAVALLACTSLVIAPLRIHTAFAEPIKLTTEQLPALQGGPIDFDHTIRFLGYTQADRNVYLGEMHHITLCWQVLKPTDHLAAFALKFFLSPTVTVGERTSVHGLGHYPSSLWQPGAVFCDTVDVPITGSIEPGQVYNMILVILDTQTMAANWPATLPPDNIPVQYAFIGQVVGAKR